MAFLNILLLATLLSSSTFASAIPNQLLPKRDGCQRGQRTINGQLYTVSCGTDHPGGDYFALQYPSFEGCIQACAADPECVTAQYAENTNYCYFKSQLNWGSLNSNVNTIVRGDDCVFGENRPIGNRICNIACGRDRPGGDYKRAQLQSFEACIESCGNDPQCVSAQWDNNIGFCYYKNKITDTTVQSNVDTVICIQSNPHPPPSSTTTTVASTTTTVAPTTTIATTTTTTKTKAPTTTTTATPTSITTTTTTTTAKQQR